MGAANCHELHRLETSPYAHRYARPASRKELRLLRPGTLRSRQVLLRRPVLSCGGQTEGIAALQDGDGPELQVHGSGYLIQRLLRHNLVDQCRLWVFPLVIGSGKRLFSEGTVPAGLKLVDSKVSTTGVVIGTYAPAGEIVTGSF